MVVDEAIAPAVTSLLGTDDSAVAWDTIPVFSSTFPVVLVVLVDGLTVDDAMYKS